MALGEMEAKVAIVEARAQAMKEVLNESRDQVTAAKEEVGYGSTGL